MSHPNDRPATLPHPKIDDDHAFRLLVDGMVEYAICMLDPEGIIRTWNHAAEIYQGYIAEEIVGQHYSVLFTPEGQEAGTPSLLLEQSMAHGRVQETGVRVRKDRSVFQADIMIAAIRTGNGDLLGYGQVMREVTHYQDAEEERQASAGRMRAIVETVPDGIITINAQGLIETFNPAAERMFGYQLEEVIGKNVKILMPEPFHSEHDSYLQNYHQTGEAKIIGIGREVTARKKDGLSFPIELAVGKFEEGGEKLFAGVIRDISERKEAERQQKDATERIRAIVETVPDGIITIDDNACVETFNPAAEKLFGFDAEEVIGNNVKMLMPEPYHSEHDEYLHAYHKTGDAKIIGIGREVMAKRKNGSVFPIELAVGDIQLGDRRMYAGVVRDMTERKLAEDSMRHLNEALKTRVRERTEAMRDLQSAVAQLQDAQNQLVQTEKLASLGGLVAGIAHEINTPVGIGVTAASHLQDITTNIDEAFQAANMKRSDLAEYFANSKQSTEIILNNLRRAAGLINSFKQVAVDQASSERRRFNLRSYIEEVLLSLRPQLRQSHHNFELHCPAHLELDTYPGALAQIITNLVMNANLHAFEEGQQGNVRIDVEEVEAGMVMQFRDDGCGISTDELTRIFDPFYTTRRGKGGSGLGLHIVYNLATQTLKGKIEVESALKTGTVFRLTLPR